eukprot:363435-Chlamydomonas_euryale.AAC.4
MDRSPTCGLALGPTRQGCQVRCLFPAATYACQFASRGYMCLASVSLPCLQCLRLPALRLCWQGKENYKCGLRGDRGTLNLYPGSALSHGLEITRPLKR